MDIISKIKKAELKGRSGSGFPTYLKWEAVLNSEAEKKYIICNAAEGELDVFKDRYILENYLEEVINGIKIALKTFQNSSAFIYLNPNYFILFEDKIKKLTKKLDIKVIKKQGGYIGGEETVVCNVIEGKDMRPNKKPPFVSEVGLFDCPTLVNNVETFYCISKIEKKEYEHEKFYCIIGDIKNSGVFKLKENDSIKDILIKTKNYSDNDFYIQIGGGAIGEILTKEEFDKNIMGTGFIRVVDSKTDPYSLMEKWAEFLCAGNCDRCTPCREGTYRILEMVKKRNIDFKKMEDILFTLDETSFCALGKGISIPFRSMINKIILK